MCKFFFFVGIFLILVAVYTCITDVVQCDSGVLDAVAQELPLGLVRVLIYIFFFHTAIVSLSFMRYHKSSMPYAWRTGFVVEQFTT